MGENEHGPWPARTLSVPIRAPVERVYAFAHDARNLPKWANGLGDHVRPSGDAWIVRTPEGEVELEFAADNAVGVLDHTVRTQDGQEFYNPMRVVPNGQGCEVLFTLYQRPGTTAADVDRDAATVEKDLLTLKALMETT